MFLLLFFLSYFSVLLSNFRAKKNGISVGSDGVVNLALEVPGTTISQIKANVIFFFILVCLGYPFRPRWVWLDKCLNYGRRILSQ